VLSAEWHTRFAHCTHNRAIGLLAESLHDPMIRSLQQARSTEPTHGRRGVEEHRALVEAVAERDVERATELMSVHLNRTAARVAVAEKTEHAG
jgi:DNA-binding FadR family transcriptional regulator